MVYVCVIVNRLRQKMTDEILINPSLLLANQILITIIVGVLI